MRAATPNPETRMSSPEQAPSLPEACDVAVIGGGIVGVSAAWYLARRGARVVLLEKGRVGGEQSSRNWGAVRQQGRHAAELPLMIDCLRNIWTRLEADLEAELHWRQQGQMRVAYEPAQLAAWEAWMPLAREHQLDTRMLSPAEVRELLPHYAGEGCLGGMFTASDGCAEPERVSPAFAAAARRHGATVLEDCAVTAIELQDGHVCALQTERGRLRCEAAIAASGAWTSRLLRPLGHRHPSLWLRASAGQTTPIDRDLRKLVVWGRSAFRQHLDGSVTIAAGHVSHHDVTLDSPRFGLDFLPLARTPGYGDKLRFRVGRPLLDDLAGRYDDFTRFRTLDPPAHLPALHEAAARFRVEHPGVGEFRFQRTWAGYIDYMPDEIPVIDALDRPGGLVVAAGMSGHGFGFGPVAGRIASELVLDGRASHDIGAFSAARFQR